MAFELSNKFIGLTSASLLIFPPAPHALISVRAIPDPNTKVAQGNPA